jgi:hypothetical protein
MRPEALQRLHFRRIGDISFRPYLISIALFLAGQRALQPAVRKSTSVISR